MGTFFALLTVFAAIFALATFKLTVYVISECAKLRDRVKKLEKRLNINNEEDAP
ncbi:hypothetical protein LCGC14_1345340 [marine sediment metagenome]|uniref:Uncharacterized protein n=1 Tax=marine sediment metagenome TaxID=412755 RepID=A0A0F9KYP6_9ZZZZ